MDFYFPAICVQLEWEKGDFDLDVHVCRQVLCETNKEGRGPRGGKYTLMQVKEMQKVVHPTVSI